MNFPATYKDNAGTEQIHFETDGASMEVTIRGNRFTGENFDELLSIDAPGRMGQGMTSDRFGYITNCIFDIAIPIRIQQQAMEKLATLSFRLYLQQQQLTRYDQLAFSIDGHTRIDFPESKGDFIMENILPAVKKALPENIHLLCCFYCAFSNYNPYGNGDFGAMRCYKLMKEEVLSIANKSDLMNLGTLHANRIRLTQETWHCSEFQPPAPDQWRYI
jgi:hypothetical protein